MSNPKRSKLLLAVGGTGGHLFPAQALARELKEVDLLFAGSGLSKNRYFQKEQYPYREIQSGTFLTSNLKRNLKGIFSLARGFYQSFKLFREFAPDLVVGFGSYHIFPLLLAARLKKIPILLFASDAVPGKVIRFFSKKALLSAVQFEEAQTYLKGRSAVVNMPFWSSGDPYLSKSQAKAYYELDPTRLTLLIFGGSQGALALNQIAAHISLNQPFQVLHFVGHEKNREEIQELYQKRQIKACVKAFEDKMHYAWKAADLAICRAGAATLSEMLFYEVPAVLVPYPYAADDHQRHNAQIFEKKIRGAKMVLEKELTPEKLSQIIEELPFLKMRENLALFKQNEKKEELSSLIKTYLKL